MTDLHEVAARVLGMPLEQIDDATSPRTAKSWDSLNHINLVLAIETSYGVQFAPSEIMLINSLGSARGLLQKKGIAV